MIEVILRYSDTLLWYSAAICFCSGTNESMARRVELRVLIAALEVRTTDVDNIIRFDCLFEFAMACETIGQSAEHSKH